MMKRIELSHLRTFVAVADLGSITRAADRLACVQSNVTARVLQLEEHLAVRLFARSRRGVALTEAGARLYPRAREILDRVQSLNEPAASAGVSGSLRLGVVETVATLDLPDMLSALRKRHPELSVELSTGTTQELVRSLKELRLDAAIASGMTADKAIECVALRADELVVVHSAAGDMPPIRRNRPAPPVFVYKTGCAFRAALENWLGSLKCAPTAVNELGTLDGILAHVASGNGFTALPARIVGRHLLRRALRTHPMPGPFGKIRTGIAFLRDGADSPRLQAVRDTALECLRASSQ